MLRFLKKKPTLTTTQIDRVSPSMSDFKEKDLQIYTQTGRTEVLSDYYFVPPPLQPQWMEAVGSEQWAHSEIKNCWKLKNYRLWTHPIAVLPTASHKQPGGIQVCMEMSAIRKEFVKWWKLKKIRLSSFGKEKKETQKIFGKPKGELKLEEIMILRKGCVFLIGLRKSLPQYSIQARVYQGWESKTTFQWSSE